MGHSSLTDEWPLDTILGPKANVRYPSNERVMNALVDHISKEESSLVHNTLASVMQRVALPDRVRLAKKLLAIERYSNDTNLSHLIWYGLIPSDWILRNNCWKRPGKRVGLASCGG